MSKKMVCDLCLGPIEENDLRGCIHLPKKAENLHSQNEGMFFTFGKNALVFNNESYEIEDLDICRFCVKLIRDLQRNHPTKRNF